MKILNKILSFVPVISITIFTVFLTAGIICGELHVHFPPLLMAACSFYLIAVAIAVFIRGVIFLKKPAKLAKKKIRTAYRRLKYLVRAAFSDEEDFF